MTRAETFVYDRSSRNACKVQFYTTYIRDIDNKMRQNSLSSKTLVLLFLFATQTCSKRLRYVRMHLCVFPFFSSSRFSARYKKGYRWRWCLMPFLSETAGSRKVSAGWSLGSRVPSLDCTIHNVQNLSVFALPSSLNSLPAGLVLRLPRYITDLHFWK